MQVESTHFKPLMFIFRCIHTHLANYNPFVGRGRNGEVRRTRVETKSPQGGRKRHGSHRSTIIGKYQFKTKPVTELHKPGIIWK